MAETPWIIWKTQRIWRRHVQYPYWATHCIWLQQTGRFFWFKDCPDWFVNLLAFEPYRGYDEDIEELLDAAYDERELRRSSRRRKAKEQKSKSHQGIE